MSPELEHVIRVACDSTGCKNVFECAEPRSRGAATGGVMRLLPLLRNRRWGIVTVHEPAGVLSSVVPSDGSTQDQRYALCPDHYEAVRVALGWRPATPRPPAVRIDPDGVAEAPPLTWKDGVE